MTLAPPHVHTSASTASPSTPVVTAVLVVHDGARWLPECLDALAGQSTAPDRLVVVDTGSNDDSAAILASHKGVRDAISDLRVLTVARETAFGAAVALAVAEVPEAVSSADWLWLLHDDSAAAETTLARLLDAARRSSSVGVAGPKLTTWQDPGRLLEVGAQVTRSGRRSGGPAHGEPDQGQHDHRFDVLAVNTSGMLVRRDVFEAVGGFDPAYRLFRDDLDLSWRAHLAGHRVVVVPKATMREAAASTRGLRSDDLDRFAARRLDRRHGRQVALARCSLPLMPLLALWIGLTSLTACLTLLAVKRPRRALAELGDLAALLTPWRVLGSRWRSRGSRSMRRRDLRGLFVPGAVALRHTLDVIHDAVAFEGSGSAAPLTDPAPAPAMVETGPAADEFEDLSVLPATWPQRLARHPGVLAVLLTTVVAVVAWRSLLATGALSPTSGGVLGGELRPVASDASGLWHAWIDGWHGGGMGNAVEPGPWLAVLAGYVWLVSQLPFVGDATSPASSAVAWLLFASLPLSAATAYLGGRVATRSRWPRAWAAVAWATLATVSTAVAAGRLGAVVAHLLLPLVAAGIACVARRSGSTTVLFGTALGMATVGAFDPPMLILLLLAALGLLVVGPGARRVRALVLLAVPVGLLGPWLLRVVAEPTLLLTGPGLSVWGTPAPQPWQLALLHPGGPAAYPALLSAPVVLAGLVGLLRRERVSGVMSVLGLAAVAGLAAAVVAPRLVLAHLPGAGGGAGAVTPWPGTGLDVLALALLAGAVLGLDGLSGRLARFGFGWRQVLSASTVAVAGLAVVAVAGLVAWFGVSGPDGLRSGGARVPAVATDQAQSALSNRLLVVAPDAGGVTYQLVGIEPPPLVRELPSTARDNPHPVLAEAVDAAIAESSPATAKVASDRLADLGVGFVGFRGPKGSALVRRLDATAGLTRLGDSQGLVLWRVLPRAGVAVGTSVPPSRARLENTDGIPSDSVDVSGPHGALATRVDSAAYDRRLVLAEPAGWTAAARVTFGGRVLSPLAGAAQPTYALPREAGQLRVAVEPSHPWWRRGQLFLLALVVFLALPFGNRRSRRTR